MFDDASVVSCSWPLYPCSVLEQMFVSVGNAEGEWVFGPYLSQFSHEILVRRAVLRKKQILWKPQYDFRVGVFLVGFVIGGFDTEDKLVGQVVPSGIPIKLR